MGLLLGGFALMINLMRTKTAPEIYLTVEDKALGMTGFLVVESTAVGPGKGGMRMTSNVTLVEVARLANTMTWKNSLFELPFGGAKSGVVWDGGSDEKKEQFVRSFARQIKKYIPRQYVAGPDVNSGEQEMVWIADELKLWGASTGKPSKYCETKNGKKFCGLPHELGSTGYGVAVAAGVTAKILEMNPLQTTVGIHGFGNVGTFAAKHLLEGGFRVVLIAGSKGAVHRPKGFTLEEVEAVIARRQTLADLPGKKLNDDQFWSTPVDIMIPASVTNVINETNFQTIQAKLIVEGGNIPMTEDIEQQLHRHGKVIVPDFVANGGGIISSYAELQGFTPEEMFKLVEEKIARATTEVMEKSISASHYARDVAIKLAKTNLARQLGR
ncbi:MAG: Glu/Leu/Phe/Val dehydrogenase dimerization domain-containing protein [bacterium]|nr:Glu/Leu/Phe/Val dehydrogenase dimerization domain-containing protein [bacterium]